jgi:hypothetical protein
MFALLFSMPKDEGVGMLRAVQQRRQPQDWLWV